MKHYSKIIPAIIPQNKKELLDFFFAWSDVSCILHIDIVDKSVSSEETFLIKEKTQEVKNIFEYSINPIQIHLMTESIPEWIFDKKISLHSLVVSEKNYQTLLLNHESIFDAMYIFVVPDTVGIIHEKVDGFQIMTIDKIGEQGKPFSKEKGIFVKDLRGINKNTYIQIDGGVQKEMVQEFKEAVDGFVVGSYLLKSASSIDTYYDLLSVLE